MAVNNDYLLFIQDQLSCIGTFETKKMFGGVGFFKEGIMSGMIGYGAFRLKVDDTTKADYLAKGISAMMSKNGKSSIPYWEVPPEVYEDLQLLKEWAGSAILVAKNAKSR